MDSKTPSDLAERASGHDKETQLTSAGGSSDTCAHKQRAKIIESNKEKKELFIKNTYEKRQHDQVRVHKHSDHPIESRVQRIHHLHKFMENKAQPVLAERASGRDKESYLRCAHKQQSQSIESEEERIQHFHQNINRRMQQDPAVAVVARIPKQSDHPIESQLQRIQHLHKFMDNKMQHVLIERVSGQAKESYLPSDNESSES